MALVNQEEKKTKLQIGDRLVFHCSSQAISFTRGSERLEFCFTNPETKKQHQSDKKLSYFIRSENDFISFATFLGRFFHFKGKLVKKDNSSYIWEFTSKDPGSKINFGAGTKAYIINDNASICFLSSEELHRTLMTPFVSKRLDYDDTLIILTSILDCSLAVIGEEGQGQRVFI